MILVKNRGNRVFFLLNHRKSFCEILFK